MALQKKNSGFHIVLAHKEQSLENCLALTITGHMLHHQPVYVAKATAYEH